MLLGLSVLPAGAQQAGRLYVGAELGLAAYRDGYAGVTYEDRPLAMQGFAGYRLDDRWSVELAYERLSGIESGQVAGSGTERLDIGSRLDTAAVRAILTVPLSELLRCRKRIAIFGAAGYHSSEARSDVLELGSQARTRITTQESGPTVGGGVLYGLGKIDLRGYAEWLQRDGTSKTWTTGVAFQYRF